MPEEIGTVVRVAGDTATVRLRRTTRCATCKACLLGEAGHFMVAEALNVVGAAVGETVRISSRDPNQILAGVLIYIIPLTLFLPGFALAQWLAGRLAIAGEWPGVIGGIVFLSLPYWILWLRRNRPDPYRLRIVAIVASGIRPRSA